MKYAHLEAVRFITACFAVGALLGTIRALVRPVKGKRTT